MFENIISSSTVQLVLLLSLGATSWGSNIRVLKSTLTMEQDGGELISGARLEVGDRQVYLEDLTICVRFNFPRLAPYGASMGRGQIIFISDWKETPADAEFFLLFLGANIPYTFIGFGHPQEVGSYQTFLLREPETGQFYLWATNRWTHVCVTFRKRDGHLSLIKDGKPLNVNNSYQDLKNVTIPPDFLNKIYLMRCPFNFSTSCSSPEGLMTDFNLWDRALSQEEAEDWTTCKGTMKGNIISWENAQFDKENVEEIIMPLSDICVPVKPGHVVFPMRRDFQSHVGLCSKMRGITTTVQDQAMNDRLMDEVEQWTSCGDPRDPWDGGLWAGYWDVPSEGNWTNINTGNQLGIAPDTYQNWYRVHGEPNGDRAENCVQVWSGRRAWNDEPCDSKLCGACYLERSPEFQILGLCSSTKFDIKYTWSRTPLINGRFSFRGHTDTLLMYDDVNNQWRLRMHTSDEIYATSNTTEYPFGTTKWDIHGDNCPNNGPVDLSFNACNNSEFNCRDGNCISHSMRCDEKVDCPDKTDEMNCEILRTDSSYLKDVPPPPPDNSHWEKLVVDIDILSILDIVEVDNVFSLQLRVTLTWLDQRLSLIDLHDDDNLNTLTSAFKNKIWLPQVVFFNTIEKDESLNDDKAVLTISKEGKPTKSQQTQLSSAQYFEGSENPLKSSRVYSKEFLCEFNMASYPFDSQVCSVELIMKGNTGNFVHMVKGLLQYDGPVDLSQYFVREMDLVETGYSVRVDIVFSRRIFSTMLTTYLPTALICIVCFATNYFKAFFFEATVTVNLTCLLVLTTLFIGVSNTLPTTAYVKLIDVWLLMTLTVPLFEVLLHTYIDAHREDQGRIINVHGSTMKTAFAKSKQMNGRAQSVVAPIQTLDDPSLGERVSHQLYEKIHVRNPGRVSAAQFTLRWIMPSFFVGFATIYFIIGLSI